MTQEYLDYVRYAVPIALETYIFGLPLHLGTKSKLERTTSNLSGVNANERFENSAREHKERFSYIFEQ